MKFFGWFATLIVLLFTIFELVEVPQKDIENKSSLEEKSEETRLSIEDGELASVKFSSNNKFQKKYSYGGLRNEFNLISYLKTDSIYLNVLKDYVFNYVTAYSGLSPPQII